MSNFLYSYTDFIRDRIHFKKVDTTGPNRFDSPAELYYKIVFYFSDENGLLGLYNITTDNSDPSVKAAANVIASFKGGQEPNNTAKNNVFRNTAYNYLLLNNELERAEYLKRFLILLSDICADSPWYFQEIGGLDTALERKVFSEGEFKLEDKPRQITIKCLNDSYDNRIGTLLDLYRAACFSYQNKKEIVPANLRKFNMGILVFNAPIRGKGGKSGDPNNMITIPDSSVNFYIPSCKLIELRSCEFDYNSAKSAFGTLNTTDESFEPQYTITINFNECYESRYNEIAQMVVTDFINIDIRPKRLGLDYDNTMMARGVNPLGNENGPLSYSNDTKEFWTNKTLETGTGQDNIEDVYSTDIVAQNVSIDKKIPIPRTSPDFVNMPGGAFGDAINQGKQIVQKLSKPENILKNTGKNLINTGKTALQKEFDKLYVGNLKGHSLRDIMTQANRVLTGDVFAIQSFTTNFGNKNLPGYPGERKEDKGEKANLPDYPGERDVDKELKDILPGHFGWQKQRTEFLTKMNTAKSLRNNL